MQGDSQLTKDLMTLAEAALIDLPLLAVERFFNRKSDEQLVLAGWEAYDAAIGIVTELTNRAYESPAIGRAAGRAVEVTLGFQRLGQAAADAFLATLWPVLGLPTAREVRALHDAVSSLRQDLQAAALEHERTESPLSLTYRDAGPAGWAFVPESAAQG
jgi:hypothetical protein